MAPVSDYSLNLPSAQRQSTAVPAEGFYRVESGDTLYSIAWRYGKDYRGLARANGIDNNYRIYPGQRLQLIEAESQVNNPAGKPALNPSSGSLQVSRAQPKPQVSAPKEPQPNSPSPAYQPSSAKVDSASEPVTASTAAVVWRWPVKGRVIQSYAAKGVQNLGLNITGKRGQPVFSAASGMVVYAGDGLLGYGNLIIINHNETFLSAYAHNDKLLVKEQERVALGQKIAEMGNSGVNRTMLHFEIRKEGKPVDPVRYLPRR
tara:strand:- start:931 stop:1713 length:783 start_codon:yes stop_codon:yes gene_type:complete